VGSTRGFGVDMRAPELIRRARFQTGSEPEATGHAGAWKNRRARELDPRLARVSLRRHEQDRRGRREHAGPRVADDGQGARPIVGVANRATFIVELAGLAVGRAVPRIAGRARGGVVVEVVDPVGGDHRFHDAEGQSRGGEARGADGERAKRRQR